MSAKCPSRPDGSTDASDAIVARYAERGVELLRLTERRGKTAAENAARPYLSGDIIVNTDASVRLHPRAVMELMDAIYRSADQGREVKIG